MTQLQTAAPSRPVSIPAVPPPSPSPSTNAAQAAGERWVKKFAGRFVVFEGPDGSGKSTQFRRFADACKAQNVALCEVREPGGTPVGERIREVLLERVGAGMEMGVRCEALLYMASRAELVEKKILPALAKGQTVLADRYVSSTLAYQGAAGGLASSDIAAVARVATRNLQPDLVVVFDIDEKAAARRLNPLLDRIEAKGAAFHRAVRQGYLDQAKADPGRYLVLDASRSADEVWATLAAMMTERAERLPPPRRITR